MGAWRKDDVVSAKLFLKNHAPRPVFEILKRVRQYGLRLSDWSRVARDVRGKTSADTLKLWTSIVAGPVTALYRLGDWGYPHLLFDVEVTVLKDLHFVCRAGTDELFQVTPSNQKEVRGVIEDFVGEGDTFLDVGANVGFFTVLAARRVGPSGKVFSFEMMPDTAARLRGNIDRNRLENVTVVECALSDEDGRSCVARKPVGSAGQASVAETEWQDKPHEETIVQTSTLDSAIGDTGPIALIKADVEGHEESVFRGGPLALTRTGAVVFEYWPDDARAVAAADHLRTVGFTAQRPLSYNMLAERENA